MFVCMSGLYKNTFLFIYYNGKELLLLFLFHKKIDLAEKMFKF